jgi:nucleotide-binding universal stress UspA family protein
MTRGMSTPPPRRVIVGVDTSLAGLEALRRGVGEARRDGVLYAVRVWTRPLASAGPLVPPIVLGDSLACDARLYVERAFCEAMGGVPTDLPIHVATPEGAPGPTLVRLADRENDILVVGTGGRGWLHRLVFGSVSRYCLSHARCPVLGVPAHALAREVGHHGRRARQCWRELPVEVSAPRPRGRQGSTDASRQHGWRHRGQG